MVLYGIESVDGGIPEISRARPSFCTARYDDDSDGSRGGGCYFQRELLLFIFFPGAAVVTPSGPNGERASGSAMNRHRELRQQVRSPAARGSPARKPISMRRM